MILAIAFAVLVGIGIGFGLGRIKNRAKLAAISAVITRAETAATKDVAIVIADVRSNL